MTIPQNIPEEPNAKKPFTVSLSISYSVPRRYSRIQAESKEQALEIALEQLQKDTWGVQDVKVMSVEEG